MAENLNIRELREKRLRQFMNQREIEEERQSMGELYGNQPEYNPRSYESANLGTESVLQRNENADMVNKLTEKLTEKIRNQLEKEMRSKGFRSSNVDLSKVDLTGAISKELESNSCLICYELMVPPKKKPMLLFPCGHTLCAECLEQYHKQHLKKICPYCRAKIQNQAVNQSLLGLMNAISDKKVMEESAGNAAKQSREQETSIERYENDYEMLGIRCEVLQGERSTKLDEIRYLRNESKSTDTTLEILRTEERNVMDQIDRLEKELRLVRDHLINHKKIRDEYDDKVLSLEDNIKLIDSTIGPLKTEREKCRLMIETLRSNAQY